MPAKTWGTPQSIREYRIVDENTAIPPGEKAYLYNRDTREHSVLGVPQWEAFMAGDLTEIINKIESDVSGSKVVWLRLMWDKAELKHEYPEYWVYGFRIEAIVENIAEAGSLIVWTASMILAVFFGVAFLAAVLAAIVLAAWLIWEVLSSVPQEFRWLVALALLGIVGVPTAIIFGNVFMGRR